MEYHHIDMSGKICEKKNIGIACLSLPTKKHNGCALKGNLIKFIDKTLFIGNIREEQAKLYAICIYLLIKDKIKEIGTLVICNDEEFQYVKEYLLFLLGIPPSFEIIDLEEFKRKLGKNIKSPADNFAKSYRKRALNKNKWSIGHQLNVVNIDYSIIKEYWDKLKEIK